MAIVRWVLGRIILVYEQLFTSKPPQLSADHQQQLTEASKNLVLYEFATCPFCVTVRMHAASIGLQLERRDVKRNAQWMDELMTGGQVHQVPCLRIDHGADNIEWLYDSSAINEYLSANFGKLPTQRVQPA